MVPGTQVARVAAPPSVQKPALVLAGEPQKRSAFSHSTTPPQLSSR